MVEKQHKDAYPRERGRTDPGLELRSIPEQLSQRAVPGRGRGQLDSHFLLPFEDGGEGEGECLSFQLQ